jgi:gluconolactonase
LLVAEHLRNRVLRYAIGEGGKLSKGEEWQKLSALAADPKETGWWLGPDGPKVDSRGDVYICQLGAGRVLVTDADGKLLRTVAVPLKYVTNVAFGPTKETLFVTAVKDSEEPYLGAVYEIPNQ